MREHILQLLIIGMVIGANNLTLSLTLGSMGQRHRRFRIVSVFAFFEFTVPLVGVWLGREVSTAISGDASWIGPALLAGFGIFTVITSSRSRKDRRMLAEAVTSWKGLAGLSAGLSVDNLVVGFSLGLDGIPPLALAVTVMCFSVVFSWLGLHVGHLVKKDYGTAGTALTGVLLILLAGASMAGWV